MGPDDSPENHKLLGSRGKRTELIRQIAKALLNAGVAQIPLRELAALLGTSDRMLLYYFDDKADLVRSSLGEISLRLAAKLVAVLPTGRHSPAKIVSIVLPLFLSPSMSQYMNVWSDIAARGARGEAPFQDIARGAVENWLNWLEDRLDLRRGTNRRHTATAILTVLEGSRLLEASSPGSMEGATAILSRCFR